MCSTNSSAYPKNIERIHNFTRSVIILGAIDMTALKMIMSGIKWGGELIEKYINSIHRLNIWSVWSIARIRLCYVMISWLVVCKWFFSLLQMSMSVGCQKDPVRTAAWTQWGVTVVSAIMDTLCTMMAKPAWVRQSKRH